MSGPLLLIVRLLMVISLYVFMGVVLYTLWRDLKQQSQVFSGQVRALVLRRPENNWRYRFTRPEVVIGRDPACDCPLDDNTVSVKHARLTFRRGKWWLEDMHSTNGTFVNQDEVTSPTVITSGDQLRCGQISMVVSVEE